MYCHFSYGGISNYILSVLIHRVGVDEKYPSPETVFETGILTSLSIGLPKRLILMLPATCKRALSQWGFLKILWRRFDIPQVDNREVMGHERWEFIIRLVRG